MDTEIEAKWLNIDIEAFHHKLQAAGAVLQQPERAMTRRIYDFPDKRLDRVGGWVRVRDENDKVTLSYKQLSDRSVTGTKEVMVTVDDFDATCAFLAAIGLVSNSYQETRRESWKLGRADIEIDTWPWIPSFVEIEAPNESVLAETAQIMGLNMTDALHGSVETAYQAVYDVTEDEVNSWNEIRFIPIPGWLAAKAKD